MCGYATNPFSLVAPCATFFFHLLYPHTSAVGVLLYVVWLGLSVTGSEGVPLFPITLYIYCAPSIKGIFRSPATTVFLLISFPRNFIVSLTFVVLLGCGGIRETAFRRVYYQPVAVPICLLIMNINVNLL